MKGLLVCSCNADDRFSPISMFVMKNKLAQVVEGVKKLASDSDANIMYLLPEGETVDGLEGEVRYGMTSPTLGNAYAVAQLLSGNLPRPMIQDDFVAVYEDQAVTVITPEAAYMAATDSKTKFVAVNRGGTTEIKEVALGTKMSDVVDASDAKAVLLGGLKGIFVKPSELGSYEVTNDDLGNSVTVYGKDACIVDTVKNMMRMACEDSCGKCVLCREGSSQFKQITEEMTTGKAKPADIDLIKDVASLIEIGAYCPFGRCMPKSLVSAIELFPEEFEEHIRRKSCSAGVCYKAEAVYIILPDKCTGCGDCVDECPEEAIEGKSKFIHMIDPDMCENCGKCAAACDEGAIVAWEGKLPKLPKKLTKVGKF